MCQQAIGDGLLTGNTEAVVDVYSMNVTQVHADLKEDELTEFMRQRIDNGDLELEDIPVRLARYGLMKPADFVNEMSERMETRDEDNSTERPSL